MDIMRKTEEAKMNYSEMSDHKINVAVAKKLGNEFTRLDLPNVGMVVCIKSPFGDDWVPERVPDYCNSWKDIGPIIESNQIAIQPRSVVEGCWYAWIEKVGEDIEVTDKNPKRAAAIAFLMMEKEQ